jgi:hypothetical protein
MCLPSPETPGKVLAAAAGAGELCAPSGFEGAEKRLELDFVCANAAGACQGLSGPSVWPNCRGFQGCRAADAPRRRWSRF